MKQKSASGKKHSLTSPILALLAAASLCALLAPFIYAYGFIFPQGDDFDETTRAVCLFDFIGGLYEVAREWFSWSGRYTYHFMAVFFGKAAESRFWSGAVCFAVLLSYGFAFWWLISPIVARRFYSSLHAVIFSLASLVALYAAYGTLPNFYLLTDAISAAHQGATALLFLALVIMLWQKVDSGPGACKKEWRRALLTGIFAIGVYEHAALAVICISLTTVCLAILLHRLNHLPLLSKLRLRHEINSSGKWKKLLNRMLGKFNTPLIRPFITLFLCLLLPLAISFLAPGNFMRNIKRGVDLVTQLEQLGMVLHDWLSAMSVFLESPWIPLLICLIVAMRFFVEPDAPKDPLFSLFTAIASIICFLVFSFSLVFLHALTDVPILSQPKLVASFGFYAAITFSVLLFHALSYLTLPERLPRTARSLLALLCMTAFAWLCVNTVNFRATFINAANGSFLALAENMKARDNWLADLRKSHAIEPDPTGLVGEILFPGLRERTARPEISMAIVKRLGQSVFPVYMQDALAMDCESWPNLWAAWMYGQGCVCAKPPEDATALALASSGMGIKLAVPQPLREMGINAAWRVTASGGEGPTFSLTWLVLDIKEMQTGEVNILRENPLSPWRLIPLAFQKKLLEILCKKTDFLLNTKDKLTGTVLSFAVSAQKSGLMAFPLGQSHTFSTHFPPTVFLSTNGMRFYALPEAKQGEKHDI